MTRHLLVPVLMLLALPAMAQESKQGTEGQDTQGAPATAAQASWQQGNAVADQVRMMLETPWDTEVTNQAKP
jgi:hypothetical protein